MSSIRKVLLVIGSAASMAVGIICGLAAGQPDDFRIERSVNIAAPSAKVFSFVDPLAKLEGWSPWKARDPSIQYTYEGPASGVGAKQLWTSEQSGSGSLTVTAFEPQQKIAYTMTFDDWKATNAGELTLSPEASGTKVSWVMTGKNDFLAKIYWLVLNIDTALGRDFEDGLARLKKLAEELA